MNAKGLCKLHPDFHIPPETVGVGENFDGTAYCASLKAHAVDSVVMFGKCHYGLSYFPTKFGTVHPGLVKDMVNEVSKGAKIHGLECIVYFSVFLDTAAIDKNPSWRMLPNRDGQFKRSKYEPVCVNSPYLEELFIPQALEVLEKYPVDQFFFDTMTWFEPCYCKSCVEKFGGEIPSETDANWLDYVRWLHQCYRNFYAKTAEAVNGKNPDVLCTFNWEWTLRHPEEPVAYVKRLAGDYFPTGKESSFFMRYLSGTGYPFDYMTGRFMHGLGDWVNNSDVTLLYTAAAAIANGAGMYIIDRQLPNGLLEDRSYSVMDTVFSFINNRRDLLTDAVPVRETAVLTTCDHLVGSRLELFPQKTTRIKRLDIFRSMHQILTENGVHFTFLNEENFLKNIQDYKFVILPELHDVSQTLSSALKDFVEKGGSLLIIQPDEESVNAELAALAGIYAAGKTPLEYTYVEFSRDGKTNAPFIVYGSNHLVLPCEGTQALARIIKPLQSNNGDFGHGVAPAVGTTEYAAATIRQVGKGQVAYVALQILSSNLANYNQDYWQFLAGLTDKIMPEPTARLVTDAPVEMSLMRKDSDLIIHLVNHGGPETRSWAWSQTTKYMPKINDICLSVKPGKSGNNPDISAFDCEYGVKISDGGRIEISGLCLHVMQSVRIKNYF
jgi:hypothetical protein